MIPTEPKNAAVALEQNVPADQDLSLVWAREHYSRALTVFIRISPVTTLDGAQAGDVMFSKSGNVRLITAVAKQRTNVYLEFLTLTQNGTLKIEQALRRRIDLVRLDSLIGRRAGNPLEKYMDVVDNLRNEPVVMHNLEVMLKLGTIGKHVRIALGRSEDRSGIFSEIEFSAAADSGEILGVAGIEPCPPGETLKLTFNKLKVPSEDYIKSARFGGAVQAEARRSILAACVLANTLENVRNLISMGKLSGL